jgi:hypothetical protein
VTRHGDPLAFLVRLAAMPERSECVEWPYAINARGYGHLWVGGRDVLAGRQALVLLTGEDSPDLVARHGPCHNRPCVNPYHLSWGTEADNARDKIRDGTHNAGTAHHQARLTQADVLEIRRRYVEGALQRELATEYGVTRGHISGIVRGRFWPQHARGSVEHGQAETDYRLVPR